jgi:hypothetical protein
LGRIHSPALIIAMIPYHPLNLITILAIVFIRNTSLLEGKEVVLMNAWIE